MFWCLSVVRIIWGVCPCAAHGGGEPAACVRGAGVARWVEGGARAGNAHGRAGERGRVRGADVLGGAPQMENA